MGKQGRLLDIKGKVGLGDKSAVDFQLPLIIFEEDGATICYCPALDLSGYGKTEVEARDSFSYVLSEYFDYTTKKKTLTADLKRLGWQVKKSLRKSMTPPAMTSLLENNEHFKRVFENYDYKKLNTNIQIPSFA